MRKIGCAIERIDDPFPFQILGSSGGAGFFCENRVIWIVLPNGLDNQSFGFFVRNRDKVRPSFQLHLLFAAHVVLQDIAAGAGELDCEVEMFHYLGWALEAFPAVIRSISLM